MFEQIMIFIFFIVSINTYFFISHYISILHDFLVFPVFLITSVCTGVFLMYSLVTNAFDRCTEPFHRFKLRQSIVFKKLFKDIMSSFMGTLWRAYEFHVGEDLEIYESQQVKEFFDDSPTCEILDMSPKEEESPRTREQNARLYNRRPQRYFQPLTPQTGQLHPNPNPIPIPHQQFQNIHNVHPNAYVYPNYYLFNFPNCLPPPPREIFQHNYEM